MAKSYHHGDLERALVEAAAAIIGEEGAEALTLRGVGARLGVSRTALYRHFDDKAALLARVALEGFRGLGRELRAALEAARAGGLDPLVELGVAYVRYGAAHPSHYRTMFGGPPDLHFRHADLAEEAQATFAILADEVALGQREGRLVAGDAPAIARFVWATVHGIVTLGHDGRLGVGHPGAVDLEGLARLSTRSLLDGLAADRPG